MGHTTLQCAFSSPYSDPIVIIESSWQASRGRRTKTIISPRMLWNQNGANRDSKLPRFSRVATSTAGWIFEFHTHRSLRQSVATVRIRTSPTITIPPQDRRKPDRVPVVRIDRMFIWPRGVSLCIPQGLDGASSSCFRLYEIGQNDMV